MAFIAQLVKNLPAMQETLVWFLGGEDPLRRDRLHTPVFLGFPCGSTGKQSMRETWVRSLGWEDPLEKGKATQYSGLENSMGCIVQGVTKSQTRLGDFYFHFHLPLYFIKPSSPQPFSIICFFSVTIQEEVWNLLPKTLVGNTFPKFTLHLPPSLQAWFGPLSPPTGSTDIHPWHGFKTDSKVVLRCFMTCPWSLGVVFEYKFQVSAFNSHPWYKDFSFFWLEMTHSVFHSKTMRRKMVTYPNCQNTFPH